MPPPGVSQPSPAGRAGRTAGHPAKLLDQGGACRPPRGLRVDGPGETRRRGPDRRTGDPCLMPGGPGMIDATRWEPMESAPRDGTVLCLSDGREVVTGCWDGAGWVLFPEEG